MAMIHDVMPVFELFQPTTRRRRRRAARAGTATDAWVLAGGLDSFDWFKDRNKRPQGASSTSAASQALSGIKTTADGGVEIGATTTLTDVRTIAVVKEKFRLLTRGGRAGRLAADSQSGHAWRQRLAGHALLVLPLRVDLLSRRRQHLLRRHAEGHQSRACALRREPLRRGESVGYGAGARRARREDGDSQLGRRARRPAPRTSSSDRRSTSRA